LVHGRVAAAIERRNKKCKMFRRKLQNYLTLVTIDLRLIFKFGDAKEDSRTGAPFQNYPAIRLISGPLK